MRYLATDHFKNEMPKILFETDNPYKILVKLIQAISIWRELFILYEPRKMRPPCLKTMTKKEREEHLRRAGEELKKGHPVSLWLYSKSKNPHTDECYYIQKIETVTL